MSPIEETMADYAASGLTIGPHAMAYFRERLRELGVVTSAALRHVRNGRHVCIAGHVIVRQRPGTAKGMLFLTLEDETGTCNAVVTPRVIRHNRRLLYACRALLIEGPVQKVGGVIHVKGLRFQELPFLGAGCGTAEMEEGRFTRSLIPVRSPDGQIVLDKDEHPRPQTTLEGLAKLEPSFIQLGQYVQKGDRLTFDDKARQVYPQVEKLEHVHTAGNSSGIVDGAAIKSVHGSSDRVLVGGGAGPRDSRRCRSSRSSSLGSPSTARTTTRGRRRRSRRGRLRDTPSRQS